MNLIGDDIFAHIFLAIDSADDDVTYSELEEIVKVSYGTIAKCIKELKEMGCIKIHCENIEFGVNINYVYPTGHNCYFCSPTIVYEKD